MSIESPNADMIFEALQMLDGYWTEEYIRTTADEAIRNAEQWLRHTDEGSALCRERSPGNRHERTASPVHRFALNASGIMQHEAARPPRPPIQAVRLGLTYNAAQEV